MFEMAAILEGIPKRGPGANAPSREEYEALKVRAAETEERIRIAAVNGKSV